MIAHEADGPACQVEVRLVERGWDVIQRDEDEVSPTGTGLVYNETVNAIQNRFVPGI